MAHERKRSWWPWIVLALLVLYPLSYGPVVWLLVNGYFDNTSESFRAALTASYMPLQWFLSAVPIAARIFLGYIFLWLD